jgi:ketosteroid isomerase-like protein
MIRFSFRYLLAFSVATIPVIGQVKSSVSEMVAAENAFAALSRDTNTRNAFLSYLTDSTVMFEKGVPVRGRKSWMERPVNSTLLFWQPVFAGVSGDGKMGFSTGPWQWSKNRETSPEAFGFYASVWRKESSGWKLAADIGVSFPGKYDGSKVKISEPAARPGKTRRTIWKSDSIFFSALNNPSIRLAPYVTTDVMFLRNGVKPLTLNDIDQHRNETVTTQQYGCEVAESGDFGFCFGSSELLREDDGNSVGKRGYLRVFKLNENGDWQVILDLIGGN